MLYVQVVFALGLTNSSDSDLKEHGKGEFIIICTFIHCIV